MNELKRLQKIAGLLKESQYEDSAWDIANRIAQEQFGEFGFASLSEDQMAQIVNIQKANELAEDYYGEFGFATLSEDQMEAIFEKHPDILNTDIKEADELSSQGNSDLEFIKQSGIPLNRIMKGFVKAVRETPFDDMDTVNNTIRGISYATDIEDLATRIIDYSDHFFSDHNHVYEFIKNLIDTGYITKGAK